MKLKGLGNTFKQLKEGLGREDASRVFLLPKELATYLKHEEEINSYYNYGLREGFISDETFNWRQRLQLWLKAE